MVLRPEEPVVPLPALRSEPSTFDARAEASITFFSTLVSYMNAVTAFVEQEADSAVAAAMAGDLPPLSGQQGKLLRVRDDATGIEFQSLFPVGIDLLSASTREEQHAALGLTPFPPGTPQLWLTNTPPGNEWYLAHGFTHSRTTDQRLWEWVQNSGLLAASEGSKEKGQFGPGDGVNTFTGPDYRGMHLRIVDAGAGIDPGRVLGSEQAPYAGQTAIVGYGTSGSLGAAQSGRLLTGRGATEQGEVLESVGQAAASVDNIPGDTRGFNVAVNIMYRR